MQINLHNDIVFKWIFGRQEHTVPLISLLNAATGIPGKFSDVRILNPFDLSEPLTNEKQGILDIRGKDTDTEENRAKRAVCRWTDRQKRADELFLELRTGTPPYIWNRGLTPVPLNF